MVNADADEKPDKAAEEHEERLPEAEEKDGEREDDACDHAGDLASMRHEHGRVRFKERPERAYFFLIHLPAPRQTTRFFFARGALDISSTTTSMAKSSTPSVSCM